MKLGTLAAAVLPWLAKLPPGYQFPSPAQKACMSLAPSKFIGYTGFVVREQIVLGSIAAANERRDADSNGDPDGDPDGDEDDSNSNISISITQCIHGDAVRDYQVEGPLWNQTYCLTSVSDGTQMVAPEGDDERCVRLARRKFRVDSESDSRPGQGRPVGGFKTESGVEFGGSHAQFVRDNDDALDGQVISTQEMDAPAGESAHFDQPVRGHAPVDPEQATKSRASALLNQIPHSVFGAVFECGTNQNPDQCTPQLPLARVSPSELTLRGLWWPQPLVTLPLALAGQETLGQVAKAEADQPGTQARGQNTGQDSAPQIAAAIHRIVLYTPDSLDYRYPQQDGWKQWINPVEQY